MADFRTWKMENLVKFAFEASQEIADKEIKIRHLKSDLKSCMDAYRKLNKSVNETKTKTGFDRGAELHDDVNRDAGIKKD